LLHSFCCQYFFFKLVSLDKLWPYVRAHCNYSTSSVAWFHYCFLNITTRTSFSALSCEVTFFSAFITVGTFS
jgi:hypothetical protein